MTFLITVVAVGIFFPIAFLIGVILGSIFIEDDQNELDIH